MSTIAPGTGGYASPHFRGENRAHIGAPRRWIAEKRTSRAIYCIASGHFEILSETLDTCRILSRDCDARITRRTFSPSLASVDLHFDDFKIADGKIDR